MTIRIRIPKGVQYIINDKKYTIMKAIKITILLLFLTGTIYAQNCCESGDCYIRLDDISGVDTDEYQDSLQAAACRLVQAFPEDFRRDFRVYDFGFYLHNEHFDGSYPAVFEQVKSQIDKPYYLLFGKQTDSTGVYSKIWVEVKLPETGRLSCMTQTQRKLLKTVIYTKVNDENLTKNPYVYWSKEMDAMKYMEQRIIKEVDCCDLTYRDSTTCTTCPLMENLEIYYRANGYEEYNIDILKDENGIPVEVINPFNSAILNYCDYVYELNGNNYSPYDLLEGEMPEIDNVVGVVLSNLSLCGSSSEVPVIRNRSINIDAKALFDIDFKIEGKSLVIVYQLLEDPTGGQDKLFKKYLWATRDGLVTIKPPLNPDLVGVDTEEKTYNYPFTELNECDSSSHFYEVHRDENGIYCGYELVNCEWIKRDTVEFIMPNPYPNNPDDDQYHIGRQIAKREEIVIPKELPSGAITNTIKYVYTPFRCKPCYDYSIGDKKNISTEDLMRGFYSNLTYGGDPHLNEENSVFNSFVYGEGQPVIWNPNSSISEELLEDDSDVERIISAIEDTIRSWISLHDDINGLIKSGKLHNATWPIPDFTGNLVDLWKFQMFGGFQARSVKIVKFKEENSISCQNKRKIDVEFIFKLIDNFGLNDQEAWYVPGLAEQWVLQHYRNNYCCNGKAFSPIVNHEIVFHHSFEICNP